MGIALLQLRSWLSFVLPHHDDDDGTSVVEYALVLALIAVVALFATWHLPTKQPEASDTQLA